MLSKDVEEEQSATLTFGAVCAAASLPLIVGSWRCPDLLHAVSAGHVSVTPTAGMLGSALHLAVLLTLFSNLGQSMFRTCSQRTSGQLLPFAAGKAGSRDNGHFARFGPFYYVLAATVLVLVQPIYLVLGLSEGKHVMLQHTLALRAAAAAGLGLLALGVSSSAMRSPCGDHL
eukprot:TRINITY_DN82451_c0_g1_i1.p1 TRINITY_DN82451_c0_g1~~TRINITY_DN82451_c0_g1_i1.p1  ORF type:complete len:173 (-),score=30.63 TRINITY_DN82451_c0_g1_i1:24-542(-)